jgi:FkbM family methyltransferase
MSAWCKQFREPVILDVGGHVGFIATQLALLLRNTKPKIYSFEPVPYTFQRLVESVNLLGLQDYVYPICSALSNDAGIARICYSEWDSMLAQVVVSNPNDRIGDKITFVNTLTIDQVASTLGETPTLIKIDVEGHEVSVLQGARKILSKNDKPSICFELNPQTLSEANTSVEELIGQLEGYDFFYINDFEGQRNELGIMISDFSRIDWVCNIFAVPKTESALKRWNNALTIAKKELARLH